MKKMLTAVSSALLCLFVGAASFADEHESDDLSWIPVEAFACTFKDGKGPDDLAEANETFNDWMDDNGSGKYFAFTVWPRYYGELAFDFAWFGVWPDGNAMGADSDKWINDGGEVGAEYGAIIDCGQATQFASTRVKAPVEGDDDGSFALGFSDCSFKEDGGGMEAYLAAHEEWNAYAEEHGIVGGAWMLFPIYGENVAAEYDFKIATSTPDFTTWGGNWHKFATEHHYRKESELFNPIVDCDSTRLYSAKVVRETDDDE